MSIKVQSYVWEHSRAKGSALLLLLAIADHAHDDGTGAWPSMERLARKCRQSVRNVQYLLDKLVDLKELRIEPDAGPNGTNAYMIVLPAKFAGREPLDRALEQNAAPDFTTVMQTGADSSCKPARQFSPKPSITIKEEPSLISKESESAEFAAMFQSVEGAMGGELTPRECEFVKELWEEKPIFQAHYYAYLQTRDYAGGFNLRYYEKCLRGFNGSKRQLQIINQAAFSDTS